MTNAFGRAVKKEQAEKKTYLQLHGLPSLEFVGKRNRGRTGNYGIMQST